MLMDDARRADPAKYGPWAVIAGGSEGIGAAFAQRLAESGINLVLLARKPEPLEEVTAQVAALGVEVRSRAIDLTAADAMDQVKALTDDIAVGLVIYNAGSSDRVAEFLDEPLESWLRLINLNVIGQTTFTHHFGGLMRKRGHGGIILVGSIAGCCGANAFATYAAVKSFSRVLVEGLWREFSPDGVDILSLIAGSTYTPAAVRMGQPTEHPLLPTVTAMEVADAGLANLADGPVYVMPLQQEAFAYLRSLPPKEAAIAIGRSTNEMFGRTERSMA